VLLKSPASNGAMRIFGKKLLLLRNDCCKFDSKLLLSVLYQLQIVAVWSRFKKTAFFAYNDLIYLDNPKISLRKPRKISKYITILITHKNTTNINL
jgi:hypothetical protein